MNSVAIFSGLFGALVTAGLAYLIRVKLDRRNVAEAQKRLAYVHFVKISSLIALDVTLRFVLKIVIGDKLKEFEKEKAGRFEITHAISVYVAHNLKSLTPEQWNEAASGGVVVGYLKATIENLNDAKLSPQELANLPREIVPQYSQYLTYQGWLQGVLILWSTAFETKNAAWVTAEALHDQWRNVDRFVESAKALRLALIKAGAATATEAESLLKKQIETNLAVSREKMGDKQKILIALADFANEKKTEKEG